MKNRIGIICMFTGVLLLAGAVALSARNNNESQMAAEKSDQVLQQMITEIEQIPKEEYLMEPYQKEMDEMQVDGNDYIGYLSIPSLQINLPIMSEWSYSRLQSAPCRYGGSIQTNDLVIAAHNYKSHFGKIKDMKMGERVVFTSVNGKVYEYETVEAALLESTDVEILTNGEYELSLFTCTYDGRNRFVVRCAEVKQ